MTFRRSLQFMRHWVLNGVASFEIEPPDAAEIDRRRDRVLAGTTPISSPPTVRAGRSGVCLRQRISPAASLSLRLQKLDLCRAGGVWRGVGRSLLAALIARCEASGLRLMVAVIGDSGNAPSLGLHEALGFRACGPAASDRLEARAMGGQCPDDAPARIGLPPLLRWSALSPLVSSLNRVASAGFEA